METREAILRRRSIRKYKDIPISDEDLRDIMECGMYAPSASNLQPWHFVVVRSPEKKRKVEELMGIVIEKTRPELEEHFARHPEVVRETVAFMKQLGGAPVYVLVFWYKPDFNGKNPNVISMSNGAAIENILIAAADRGIGSCWLTAPLDAGIGDRLREEFAPGKGEFAAMLTLGYPDIDPKAPRRKDDRYVIV